MKDKKPSVRPRFNKPGDDWHRKDGSEVSGSSAAPLLTAALEESGYKGQEPPDDWRPAAPTTFDSMPNELYVVLNQFAPSAVIQHELHEKEFGEKRVWEFDLLTDWLIRLGVDFVPMSSGNITYLVTEG